VYAEGRDGELVMNKATCLKSSVETSSAVARKLANQWTLWPAEHGFNFTKLPAWTVVTR
jgi:hypothetical protein